MNNLNLNLNLYRSFYYVAKYGGFTKASKYALISQSSLSNNIKKLEDMLGVKLFNRSGGNVILTREGEKLFIKLNEIVNILNTNINKKEIKIGCVRFVADSYLIDTIKKFRKKYSDIRISFVFANTTELYEMLKKDELDLVICRYPLFYKFDDFILVEKIKDVENVFVCSKDFYKKERLKMKKKNYVYPLILPNSSEKRRNIEQYLIDNEFNYNILIELPNSDLLKNLIINGMGIGYINKKFMKNELDNEEVVIVDDFNNIPLDNISIIYSSNNSSSIIEFIKILKATI